MRSINLISFLLSTLVVSELCPRQDNVTVRQTYRHIVKASTLCSPYVEHSKQAFSVKRYPPPMMACLCLMACLCMKVFIAPLVPEGAKRHFFQNWLFYINVFSFTVSLSCKKTELEFWFFFQKINKTHMYQLQNHYFLGGKRYHLPNGTFWHKLNVLIVVVLSPKRCHMANGTF